MWASSWRMPDGPGFGVRTTRLGVRCRLPANTAALRRYPPPRSQASLPRPQAPPLSATSLCPDPLGYVAALGFCHAVEAACVRFGLGVGVVAYQAKISSGPNMAVVTVPITATMAIVSLTYLCKLLNQALISPSYALAFTNPALPIVAFRPPYATGPGFSGVGAWRSSGSPRAGRILIYGPPCGDVHE